MVLELPSIVKPLRSGFAAALRHVVQRERIDVIHLHFSFALPVAVAIGRHRDHLPPIFYHWHNPPKALLLQPPFGGMGRTGSRRSATLRGAITRAVIRPVSGLIARLGDTAIEAHIVISAEIENLLLRSGWANAGKILRLPNSVPAIPKEPVQVRDRPDPFVFGSVANFRPQKDHITLLHAFQRSVAEEPGLRLDLVGDGPTRPENERLARELGIDSRVRFLGYLGDPSEAYRQMDAFVLSTHYEGQVLVVLEAMGHGLPVIATDIPTIRETLDHTRALLVPPGDVGEMAASLLRLARDSALRQSLAAQSRRTALSAPSVEDWAVSLMRLYEATTMR
jgi:glycosyltransferase involved in cell wall biosynthesis